MAQVKKSKTLAERNCHMVFETNKVLGAINGYLVKTDGTAGFIKAFIYDTNEESEAAATLWANNHPRSLKNAGYGESFQMKN